MPTKADGGTPQTFGVTDYLMAFKKKGNQDAVKAFYDLYYQKDQVNQFIKAEGFLPVTKSGIQEFSSDAEAEDLPRDPAERAPDADRRPHVGQGQARGAAEPRHRSHG